MRSKSKTNTRTYFRFLFKIGHVIRWKEQEFEDGKIVDLLIFTYSYNANNSFDCFNNNIYIEGAIKSVSNWFIDVPKLSKTIAFKKEGLVTSDSLTTLKIKPTFFTVPFSVYIQTQWEKKIKP